MKNSYPTTENYTSIYRSVVCCNSYPNSLFSRVAEEAKLNTKVEKPESAAVQSVTRRVMRVETDREKSARLASYNNIEVNKCMVACIHNYVLLGSCTMCNVPN